MVNFFIDIYLSVCLFVVKKSISPASHQKTRLAVSPLNSLREDCGVSRLKQTRSDFAKLLWLGPEAVLLSSKPLLLSGFK